MAVQKLQVFLASRFEEFQELRAAIKSRINKLKLPPVEAIDLNDNAPDSRPPLERCYRAVDQAELFVLLVGDTYGERAENHAQSYTHLEYRRALTDRSKTILPFFIGQSHDKRFKSVDYHDNNIGAWVKEIRKHHTPSYMDTGIGCDELANEIFNEVLARLVELFADVADDESEDFSEEPEHRLEDSPIRRDRLANSPGFVEGRPRNEQPLRMLASNHAREALLALDLNLPQVAMHHLKQAAESVPMDIVIGYWLARLQVATGRRKECREGRRTALLCAHLARGEEDAALQVMACELLAARASERLGEMDLAMEYVAAAHDEMPYHWMAKLEYSRQLAMAEDKDGALEKAAEAFWLRPASILQIQSDPAYSNMRKDFAAFRSRLWKSVRDEVAAIAEVESRISDFLSGFQVQRAADEVVLQATAAREIWIVESESTQPKSVNEMDGSKPRSFMRLINDGRAAARRGLDLLQQCAAQVSREAMAFEFGGVKGFTPDTRESLKSLITTTEDNIRTLEAQHVELTELARDSSYVKARFLRLVLAAGGIGVLLFLVALLADYLVIAGVIVFIAVVLGWVTREVIKSLESHIKTPSNKAKQAQRQLDQENHALTNLQRDLKIFEEGESRLRSNFLELNKLVNQFEAVALRRVTLSPLPPMDRKGDQKMVRVDPEKVSSPIELDDELLPHDLRYLNVPTRARSRYWAGKRFKSDTTESLARAPAYFQS